MVHNRCTDAPPSCVKNERVSTIPPFDNDIMATTLVGDNSDKGGYRIKLALSGTAYLSSIMESQSTAENGLQTATVR